MGSNDINQPQLTKIMDNNDIVVVTGDTDMKRAVTPIVNERNNDIDLCVTPVEDGGPNIHGDSVTGVCKPPEVGMIFEKEEDMVSYYKDYGQQQGFEVVFGGSRYNSDKTKRLAVYWTCECYGEPRKKRETVSVHSTMQPIVKAQGKSKKCGCKARVYARFDDERWKIVGVELEHKNHNPTPSKSRFIAMYREQRPHVRRRILDGHSSQIMASLTEQYNGAANMPFTEKDTRNLIDKERRLRYANGDANAMQDFFIRMSNDNPNFFYECRLETDGTLKDVLWVDARSRAAFEEFGDVVCFDATFVVNKYDLPFANFVGVNHHGQTILLGCAFVSHEDTKTYEWVFRTWINAMGGKFPAAILTDEAPTMRRAIANVVPEARHRWCIWHILQKLPLKMGTMQCFEQFHIDFKEIVYESYSPEQFECGWQVLHELYGTDLTSYPGYEWLASMFKEREMWVPAYMRNMFWAGMKSTERVESINNFFDGYMGRHTPLCEFVEKYSKAMEKRMHDERDADINGSRYLRGLRSEFMVEKFFQKIYTDAKFCEVQRECHRIMYCNSNERRNLPGVVEHVISDRVRVEKTVNSCSERIHEVSKGRNGEFTVTYNVDTHHVSCQCLLFECHGILCRHCIKVLDFHNVNEVPEKYILRRWRKDVFHKHSKIKVIYHDHSKAQDVVRYDKMHIAFDVLARKAMKSDELKDIVLTAIEQLNQKLEEAEGKHLQCVVVSDSTLGGSDPSVGNGTPSKYTGSASGVGQGSII